MPDNCAFDCDGRLWIATDGNQPSATGRADGIWAMETEGEARGTSKLFFQVPARRRNVRPVLTPDMETLFLAVQHPGENRQDGSEGGAATFETPSTRWPDFKTGYAAAARPWSRSRERGGGKIAV